jgi:hypothetical protein
MKTRLLALAAALGVLAAWACSYEPPGQCSVVAGCAVGTTCQAGVCVACAGGICTDAQVADEKGASLRVFTKPFSAISSLWVTFPPGAVPVGSQVNLQGLSSAALAALPPLTTGAVPIAAFEVTTPGLTDFSLAVHLGGTNVTALKPHTILFAARLEQGAWVDVATAITGAGGAVRTLRPTGTRNGLRKPGTVVLYQPPPGTIAVADFGLALLPNDGRGGADGLQIITLYGDDGGILATPTLQMLTHLGSPDLDGSALTPDGSQGVMVDGGNTVLFFSDISSSTPSVSGLRIDITAYGGDGDSVAIFPDGNEVVIASDGHELPLIAGLADGHPVLADTVVTPGARDGVLISDDGKVMMARGPSGLPIFAVTAVTPHPGHLGGTVSHSFRMVLDNAPGAAPLFPSGPAGEDGRDGMAFSPTDSSRALLVGFGGGTGYAPTVQLITGLPDQPQIPSTVTLPGVSEVTAVAVTKDGKRAVVGTNKGIYMFTGVETGALVLQGLFDVPYVDAGGHQVALSWGGVPTLGITLDGLYLVALTQWPDANKGTLVVVPIVPTGLGDAVGVLGGVAVPDNDQVMLH